MNTPILVTGGTGTIGRHVVRLLGEAGRDVRVLTRHPRASTVGVQHVAGDTVRGTGLAEALAGVETVLHLAGGAKGDDVAAGNLVRAAREAGARHLVLISVIGAGEMPIGYFRMKRAAEQEFERSGIPFSILRVAQLHDFVLPVARTMARMPLAPAPRGLRFEPVSVEEVAARLVEVALGEPAGRVPDLAGPEVLDIAELIRTFAEAQGRRRRLVRFAIPGAVGRAYRAGANLAGPAALRGRRTWREFLAERDGARDRAAARG
ncbi:SDR family oxidoreductase [Microbacterium sp.]|uniref:SDR family oxidoreductase n=1 Tax=Microbacterium sp. TaxID=51671 RepID=UPI002811AC19|nr:NAD(P)H-binding protein [Microbacterium sp.]